MAFRQRKTDKLDFFYPVILYYVVSAAMNQLLLPYLYLISVDLVVLRGMTAVAGGVVIYLFFVYVPQKRQWETERIDRSTSVSGAQPGAKSQRIFFRPVTADVCKGLALAAVWLSCAGIAVNNLIAVSGLQKLSGAYQQVEQAFYSSDLLCELLVLGIITPFTEELLYRSVVYQRMRESYGAVTAVIGSSLIFALLHMNLVQIIYAFVLGLLLALLMERYQDMRVPFAGHAAANIIAVLRGETGLLSWLKQGNPLFVPVTVVLAVVTIILAGYCIKSCKNEK